MRVPDPKANTTTEAYLAYKAGYLEESELKPKLYKPDWHFDGWLAYWAGLVNTYPTKENGEPEMLCDEEALVAYLSGVTNTYPEEIKDPYDVRIVGYLKYLVSARWGRPDYPVNNEEFYLSTMKPPVVPSGDTPSSDIEMDDTAEAPFIDLKMYGDTSQQTYSGANLYNYTDMSATIGSGITTDDDGWITCTVDNSAGTSTSFSNYYTKPLALSPSTQYSLVLEVLSVSGTGAIEGGGGSSASQVEYYGISFANMTSGSKYILPITSKSDVTGANGLRMYFRFNAGQSGSITVRISVLADTSVTPETFVYQPYTGGIPAPSPDYPQNIDVVTGRQVVGVKGKNLFYGSNNTSGGIVSAWEGSKVTLEGTTTSSYANITGIDPMPTVFEAGTYTFSTDSVTNEYTKVIRIREDGGNHDYTIPKGDKSITFTTSGSFTVRICFISSLSQNVGISDTFGLQLELGSEPTAYSPYGGADYEINLGKNLFDNSLLPIYSTGATSEPLSTGIRISSTQALGNSFCGFRLFKSSDFVGKTITLSANITASASNQPNAYIGLCAEDGSSRSAKVFMTGTGEKSMSYTHTAEDTNRPYIMVALYSNYAGGTPEVGDYADYNNLQLEVGSNATPYSPYFKPIELCKIGDYQDYIYRDEDGDWYLHKETGKIVFDGSENWQRNDTNEVFTLADTVPYPADGTAPYSNYFKGQADVLSYARMENNSVGFLMSSSNNRTIIKYLSETSASGFKTWLSTHNTIVYYPLATQNDAKITNSELISQLDALMEGGSYEGKTYIKVTATDPNLPGLLYVEAGKYD